MQSIRNRRKENIIALLQFTILFGILVIGIYGVLIINHRSFIKTGDGIKQGYFMTVELKHQMEMLFEGKGLQLWSWSKFLGMSVQTNRYWDPFNWMAAAFPVGYIELGYTIATLLRIYCGGVAFLVLMRYVGLKVFPCVFGATLYSFSGYTILTGLVYSDFLMNVYLFPLLVLSVEMIYKGKNPLFFSIITGIYIVSNFYCSYMAAISISIYIILRYFSYREYNLTAFSKTIGRIALYGILGICLGCIQFVPDFAALSEVSTDSVTDRSGLFFSKSYYANIGRILIGTGGIKPPAIIGWTFIIIMLLAITIAGNKLKKTPVIMTVILFIGSMIPAVCSAYNGFGYPSIRWVFALELFAAWAVAEEIDSERLLRRIDVRIAAIALGIAAFLSIGMNYVLNLGMEKSEVAFMFVQFLGGVAFLILLIRAARKASLKGLSKAGMIAILSVTLVSAWTISFMNTKTDYYKNNRINKLLQESPQRAGALIEDDDFYRIDQVDTMLDCNKVKSPPNESLWWQTRSIYGYNSRITSDMIEFNRIVGNNHGYFKRVAIVSNDNRTGLDYLYGVKYFLGDDLKYGKNKSSRHAGYGFADYENIDGVQVLKSKFPVSLGYAFDKYIKKSEFEKLGYAEREQALLQAVVMPDNIEPAKIREVKSKDIKTSVKDVNYAFEESDGATLNEDKIVVDKKNGSITIEPEPVNNSQLLLTVSSLLRNVREGQSEPFELHIENEHTEEIADNSFSNQTIPNIKDYTLNLGYYENYKNGKIKIAFTEPGTYYYDEIKIRAMDAALFDNCIETISNSAYQISSFSDNVVEGTIETETDAILFLSIIEPERWDCYIDGTKTEIIKNTNLAFTGVEIPKGHHNVMLRYNNRKSKIGIALSAFGLVVLAMVSLFRLKRKNNIDI